MPDWTDETDVLVAGSGAGGVTGAYTAAREGLRVILVEATEMFGGTTAYSGGGGMWFPANPVLLRAGLWHTADTLEALANQLGMPPQNLMATVARFNEFVARGVDEDFGRGDEAYDRAFSGGASPLQAIEKAPFHAAAFGISDLGTKGGLRADTAARGLDASGTVIPGLYAAGNTMAAPSGTAYPGGGIPIGTSMVFAHLAVQDMLTG